MFIVEFEFNDIITKMQCKKEDKLRDIFYEFSNKIEININDLLFLYKGKTVNEDFTFSQLINIFEHTGTDIKFIVYEKKQIPKHFAQGLGAKPPAEIKKAATTKP